VAPSSDSLGVRFAKQTQIRFHVFLGSWVLGFLGSWVLGNLYKRTQFKIGQINCKSFITKDIQQIAIERSLKKQTQFKPIKLSKAKSAAAQADKPKIGAERRPVPKGKRSDFSCYRPDYATIATPFGGSRRSALMQNKPKCG
jgi:hypothetical protein